jgi:predicted lipoprotein with Yx(FWY)xxD motif
MSAVGIGKLGVGAAGAVALVALVAGCGTKSSAVKPAAGGASSTPSTSSVSGSAGAPKTMSTSIGTVLVDASGRTVYELVGDSAANQTCTGSCLSTWPPVTANGSQMIVNGHPEFTFTGDTAAGQTTGQNLTDQWGRWLALDPSGNPISAPAAPKGGSSSPAAKTTAPGGGSAAF